MKNALWSPKMHATPLVTLFSLLLLHIEAFQCSPLTLCHCEFVPMRPTFDYFFSGEELIETKTCVWQTAPFIAIMANGVLGTKITVDVRRP